MAESCAPKEPFNFIINIAVHVAILFCFLSAFFILYVSKISQSALNEEIKHNLESNFVKSYDELSDEQKVGVQATLNTLPLDSLSKLYDKPHEAVKTHNEWLFKVIVGLNVVFALAITIAIAAVSYSCGQCVPFTEILMENGIIFAFVGLVEYLFFTQVAIKWVPVNPSVIVTAFFDSVKANFA